tara:strand:- start:5228 stop:5857 length:630 start_codon:yes stop_codon:yes gene_type:complete
MAHFARLDSNNIVKEVLVISNDEILDENGNESETIGIQICKNLVQYDPDILEEVGVSTGPVDTIWKKTSYNNNFRFRYAGEGYTYDSTLDAFIRPKPYESWVLDNSTADWIEPLTYPTLTQEQFDSGSFYIWDEDAHQTDNTTGWVLDTIPPPFASWIRDNNNNRFAIWNPPIDRLTLTQEQIDDGYYYTWDEDAYQADNTTGWVLTSS